MPRSADNYCVSIWGKWFGRGTVQVIAVAIFTAIGLTGAAATMLTIATDPITATAGTAAKSVQDGQASAGLDTPSRPPAEPSPSPVAEAAPPVAEESGSEITGTAGGTTSTFTYPFNVSRSSSGEGSGGSIDDGPQPSNEGQIDIRQIPEFSMSCANLDLTLLDNSAGEPTCEVRASEDPDNSLFSGADNQAVSGNIHIQPPVEPSPSPSPPA